jgi:hypothetical protein
MRIKTSKGLIVLNPVLVDSVWYVDVDCEDNSLRGDWNRYSAKQCAGSDAFGKYYDSKAHAERVVREFKKRCSTPSVAAA